MNRTWFATTRRPVISVSTLKNMEPSLSITVSESASFAGKNELDRSSYRRNSVMFGSKSATRLGIAAALLLAAVAVAIAAARIGQKAPDFKVKDLDGKTVTLDQVRKDPNRKNAQRVVLLDFWATWCPPCRREVSTLQKLHEAYEKKGVAIVGIALDEEGAKAVKPFVKDNKLTYTSLVDPGSVAARAYGVRPIPSMFLLDRKGVIRFTHIGLTEQAILEKEIKSLLK